MLDDPNGSLAPGPGFESAAAVLDRAGIRQRLAVARLPVMPQVLGRLLDACAADAADVPALFAANPGAFKIVVGTREITDIRTAYAEGAPGEVFGILGSMGYLEIVANRAAAAQITGASKGSEVSIVLGAAAGKGA